MLALALAQSRRVEFPVAAGAAAVMIWSVLLAASATPVVGPVAVVLSIVINVVARTRTRRLGALAAAVVALAARALLVRGHREQSRGRALCSLLLRARAEASERFAGGVESVGIVEKQRPVAKGGEERSYSREGRAAIRTGLATPFRRSDAVVMAIAGSDRPCGPCGRFCFSSASSARSHGPSLRRRRNATLASTSGYLDHGVGVAGCQGWGCHRMRPPCAGTSVSPRRPTGSS